MVYSDDGVKHLCQEGHQMFVTVRKLKSRIQEDPVVVPVKVRDAVLNDVIVRIPIPVVI
jgi:hypothetical protein